MKPIASMLLFVCTVGLAQEHLNYGYAALAPERPANAIETPTPSLSQSCTTGKVSVTAPLNGQQLNSPVSVQASATPDPGQSIVKMQVYVDSVNIYSVNSSAVNASFPLSSGAHKVVVTATESNGAVLSSSTVSITVNAGVVANFLGCVFPQNGNSYQAVRISLNKPATVTFDANLYYGSTCNPSQWADRFGYGQSISLGTFSYIFWFSDFANQLNMSAIWKINNQTSSCINYLVAPPC